MQKLLAAAFAALAIATPAQAAESPARTFVANRATTFCLIELGIATVDDAVDWEMSQNLKDGLSPHQIGVFNEASDGNGWVKNSVHSLISSMGGCERILTDVMRQQRQPLPATRPAYLY